LRKSGREPTMILEQWTPWRSTIEQTVAIEDQWADGVSSFLNAIGNAGPL
jgi:hypothetical protein